MESHRARLRFWSLFALIFNIMVVAWGAFVRASGSGAGCGSHWPLCNGVVLPENPNWHTVIEFGHRVTSAGSLILALGVAVLGVLGYAKGTRVRKAAIACLIFTLTEALIGAGLVLLGLVAHDRSLARAFSIALHLSNTFVLFAALALTVLWTRQTPLAPAPSSDSNPTITDLNPLPRGLTYGTLAAVFCLGLTGALTALGDTLFPSTSLLQGMTSDFSVGAHFLLRLRIVHPVLAVATAGLIFRFSEETTPRLSLWLRGLTVGQLTLGAVNLLLLAPTALQLAHLVVAESLWITLVLAAAPVLSTFDSKGSISESTSAATPQAHA